MILMTLSQHAQVLKMSYPEGEQWSDGHCRNFPVRNREFICELSSIVCLVRAIWRAWNRLILLPGQVPLLDIS